MRIGIVLFVSTKCIIFLHCHIFPVDLENKTCSLHSGSVPQGCVVSSANKHLIAMSNVTFVLLQDAQSLLFHLEFYRVNNNL